MFGWEGDDIAVGSTNIAMVGMGMVGMAGIGGIGGGGTAAAAP